MTIYAVIKTGDEQYRVAPGDVITVERLAAEPGDTVAISEVHLVAIEQELFVGKPAVANARVLAEVIEEGRGEKVLVFKKKRRKPYHQTAGYQEVFTSLRISKIVLGDTAYGIGGSRTDALKLTKAIPARLASSEPTPAEPRETTPVRAPKAPSGPPKRETSPAQRAEVPASAPAHRQVAPAHAPMSPAPQPDAIEPSASRKRGYPLAALAAVLVIGAGVLLWSGARAPKDTAPASAVPDAARPSAPKAAASEATPKKIAAAPSAPKPAPKDATLKKPAAAAAPSAPVQPPD